MKSKATAQQHQHQHRQQQQTLLWQQLFRFRKLEHPLYKPIALDIVRAIGIRAQLLWANMSVAISLVISFASFLGVPVSFRGHAFLFFLFSLVVAGLLSVDGVCCHQCIRSHNSFHYLFLVSRTLFV